MRNDVIRRVLLAVATLSTAGCGALFGQRQFRADELLARDDFVWAVDSSANFRYYVERGSPAHHVMPAVVGRMEEGLARVLSMLGQASYEPPISVFVVDSRAKMRRLVGRATNGIAFHRTNVVVVILANDWSTLTPHELLHVVAMNSWGRAETWLNEGLAVHAAGEWRGEDVHAVARRMLERDSLLPVSRLVGLFRTLDERVAYPQAGSFVRYLYETYGVDALRAVWPQGSAGVQAIYGKTLEALEREWLEMLRAAGPPE